MTSLTEQSRRSAVDSVDYWFHSIDVGDGIVTPGAKPFHVLKTDWDALALPNLAGRSVLDIGAWDGWCSFAAEESGASRVVALDHYVWSLDFPKFRQYVDEQHARGERVADATTVPQAWRPDLLPGKAGFDTAHRLRNSSVEDVVLDFAADDLEPIGRFDVVLFLGVLYHLADPIGALRRLFSVTGDLAVILTHALRVGGFEDRAFAECYPHDEFAGDPTNWWVPNMRALTGWCEAAGFTEVEVALGPPEGTPPRQGESDRYIAIVHARR